MWVFGSQTRVTSFSCKSFYMKLDLQDDLLSACALVWIDMPPRVKEFCWLVVRGKVLIVDDLRRKYLGILSQMCVAHVEGT